MACEGELLEAKRRALWSALVDAYVETGCDELADVTETGAAK